MEINERKCGFVKDALILDSCGSTNDLAKRKIREENPQSLPTYIISREQTAGKGRLGRSFSSKKGLGLYFTAIFKHTGKTSPSLFCIHAAIAVADTLKTFGVDCKVKWPNDILTNDKKLCGILCESSVGASGERYMICGIGLNLYQESGDFPEEFRSHAASVYSECGIRLSYEEVCRRLAERLAGEYERYKACESPVARYLPLCSSIGMEISYSYLNEKKFGRAVGIAEDGALIVENEEGILLLSSGEVGHIRRA